LAEGETQKKAQELVHILKERIAKNEKVSPNPEEQPAPQKELERGYIDGAFDLVHSGHFNAIR